MKTHTITCVKFSDLFKEYPEALAQFNCGDFDVSFGDAQHTLVDQSDFLNMLEDAGLTVEQLETESHPLAVKIKNQMKEVFSMIDSLGDSILIDLEN